MQRGRCTLAQSGSVQRRCSLVDRQIGGRSGPKRGSGSTAASLTALTPLAPLVVLAVLPCAVSTPVSEGGEEDEEDILGRPKERKEESLRGREFYRFKFTPFKLLSQVLSFNFDFLLVLVSTREKQELF